MKRKTEYACASHTTQSRRPRSRVITLLLAVLMCMSVGVVAFAAYGFNSSYGTSTKPEHENAPTGNPDDATNYIDATNNNGVIEIEQTVIDGDQKTFLGTIRVIGNYMYVYGYNYTSSDAPSTNSLTGWKLQTKDLGWGCVAINKTLATYSDPAGVLEGQPVTWMTYAYANCTRMTTKNGDEPFALPKIPATVKHTDMMFSGCTRLKKVSLTTANTLTVNTFYNCTGLQQIFLGKNVERISENVFNQVPSNCVIYYEGATIPKSSITGWISDWNCDLKYETDADIFIWALN